MQEIKIMHAKIGVWQEWRDHTVVKLTKTIAYIALHKMLKN